MGRWTPQHHETVLADKLYKAILPALRKHGLKFEDFVEQFDADDDVLRRILETLVKDVVSRKTLPITPTSPQTRQRMNNAILHLSRSDPYPRSHHRSHQTLSQYQALRARRRQELFFSAQDERPGPASTTTWDIFEAPMELEEESNRNSSSALYEALNDPGLPSITLPSRLDESGEDEDTPIWDWSIIDPPFPSGVSPEEFQQSPPSQLIARSPSLATTRNLSTRSTSSLSRRASLRRSLMRARTMDPSDRRSSSSSDTVTGVRDSRPEPVLNLFRPSEGDEPQNNAQDSASSNVMSSGSILRRLRHLDPPRADVLDDVASSASTVRGESHDTTNRSRRGSEPSRSVSPVIRSILDDYIPPYSYYRRRYSPQHLAPPLTSSDRLMPPRPWSVFHPGGSGLPFRSPSPIPFTIDPSHPEYLVRSPSPS
ncbi:hypothetical protein FRC02_012011 [Tulasnella sp. 418]|nr:hypothetical protein FRC02_012011 [Tulasnella sp. 418]